MDGNLLETALCLSRKCKAPIRTRGYKIQSNFSPVMATESRSSWYSWVSKVASFCRWFFLHSGKLCSRSFLQVLFLSFMIARKCKKSWICTRAVRAAIIFSYREWLFLYTAARGIFFRIIIYKYLKCRKNADNFNFYIDKWIIRVKYYHCCMCGIGTAPGGSFRSALENWV
jgi:hypothetical protein